MSDNGYLIARLPSISLTDTHLKEGPEDFLVLIKDSSVDVDIWCTRIIDWLRIANWQCEQDKLPLPFKDCGTKPVTTTESNPWLAYFETLVSSDNAPKLIAEWARLDAALLVYRSETPFAFSFDVALPNEFRPVCEGQIQTIEEAKMVDYVLAEKFFAYLDAYQYELGTYDNEQIYMYAIKLLILTRLGIGVRNEQ